MNSEEKNSRVWAHSHFLQNPFLDPPPADSLCSALTVSVFETSNFHDRFNLSLSSISQATFLHYSTGCDQDRTACYVSSTILSIFPYHHMHLFSRHVTTGLVNFFSAFFKFVVFWGGSQPTVCLYPNLKCRTKWYFAFHLHYILAVQNKMLKNKLLFFSAILIM